MVKKYNKNINAIIAQNLKKYRKAKRLSQEELAFLSGIHRTYVGSIERREKNVTINCLYKIAVAL